MNLLLVAYTFPPIPYGGTYRSLRLCKELTQNGINVSVLTINIYNNIPNDFGLQSKIPNEVEVFRTAIIDPYRKYQIIKRKYIKYNWFKLINKVISFLLRFITIPDHMILWNLTAIPKALKIIKANNIDTVIVSSPPNSSLLIGYFLKRIKKIKFISDLRDPIIGNIAEVELNRSVSFINRIERKIRNWYKNLILNNSDVIIANTETHRTLLLPDYGDKVVTIRNSFDYEEYEKQLDDWKNDKLTIAHFGSIYGLRSSNLLFKALKRVEKNCGEELQVKIKFYGLVSSELKNDIKANNVEKYTSVEGMIPHSQAIKLMQKSDYLLLIKATGPGSEGQIPGKFFEYIGAERQILCLGPLNSEVSRLIKENNLGKVIEDSEQEMYEYLSIVYNKFLAGKKESLDAGIVRKFSSERMGKNFINVIKSLN